MKTNYALLLGKILCSASWDGDCVIQESKPIIKSFLSSQTDLSEEENRIIQLYLEYPIQEDELEKMLKLAPIYFIETVNKELVAYWLDKLPKAKKPLIYRDKPFIPLIQDSLSTSNGNAEKLENIIFERDQLLPKFLANPVYYRFNWRYTGTAQKVNSRTLQKACAEFTLISRVAQADSNLHEDEKDVILDILSVNMDITHEQIRLILNIALDLSTEIFNTKKIVANYIELTSESERKTFLEILFEVIIADGVVHPCEKDILYDIASNLGVHNDLIKTGLQRMEKVVLQFGKQEI